MIYNLFNDEAATRILFYKIGSENWVIVKPFLEHLQKMPDVIVGIKNEDIFIENIPLEQNIRDQLKCL